MNPEDQDGPEVPPQLAGIGRTAAVIAIVAIAARLVGVLRVFAQAGALGASPLGDTYLAANKIPNIVFDVVAGGALSSVVIPVLAGPIARRDTAGTRAIASAFMTWTLLLLVPVSLLGVLVSRPLMTALLSGVGNAAVRADKIDVGSRMLVVFMPQIALYGVGIALTGVLQAHRRFLAPAIAPLLSSLVVICAYAAYAAQSGGDQSLQSLSRAEELTLSLGTTLGVAALTLPLLLPVRALGLRMRPTLRWPRGVAAQIRRLALAGAVALGAQQLAAAVVIVLANRVDGALVVYELAWTIFLVPWAVLAVPIATSAFPDLTQTAAAGDQRAFAAGLAAAFRAIVMVMIAAAALLIAVARPVAEGLFSVLDPDAGGVGATDLSRALMTFAPGLIGYGVVALLTRAAYARHEGRAAATAVVVGFAVAVVADVALAAAVPADWLVAALGAGNTAGMAVAALLLTRWSRAAVGPAALPPAGQLAPFALAGCAAAIAGAFAAQTASRVGPGGSLLLAVAVVTLVLLGAAGPDNRARLSSLATSLRRGRGRQ